MKHIPMRLEELERWEPAGNLLGEAAVGAALIDPIGIVAVLTSHPRLPAPAVGAGTSVSLEQLDTLGTPDTPLELSPPRAIPRSSFRRRGRSPAATLVRAAGTRYSPAPSGAGMKRSATSRSCCWTTSGSPSPRRRHRNLPPTETLPGRTLAGPQARARRSPPPQVSRRPRLSRFLPLARATARPRTDRSSRFASSGHSRPLLRPANRS